jgi:hypothetical protein
MSQMTLKIVAQVVDDASAPLKLIEQRLRSVTSAAREAAGAMAGVNGTKPGKGSAGGNSYYKNLMEKGNLAAMKAGDPDITKGLKSIATASPKAAQGLGEVKKAVQAAEADLTKFNRTLFAATAFVGTFYGAFRIGAKAVEEGAQFDRVINQFERVVGPHGDFLQALKGFTDSSVDQMAAFKAAISFNTLGVAVGMKDTAELIARASTAAKNAGLESGEGIRAVTEFVKSSNIALLKNLNLVRENDPALKLLTASISKYTGVAGGALNAQERLAIGLSALRRATQGTMFGFRDLLDTVLDLKQNTAGAFKEVGITIGGALRSTFELANDLMLGLRPLIRNLRESDSGFLFLIKSIMGVTTALALAITAFGAFKLSIKALGALGFGIPFLSSALGGLALAFGLVTSGVKLNKEEFNRAKTPVEKMLVLFKYFGEKLQVFGAFLRGTTEALISFFKPENYSRGVGVISGSVANLLEKFGLINIEVDQFGRRIAKTGAIVNFVRALAPIASFALGIKEAFVTAGKAIIKVFNAVNTVLLKVFGKGTGLLPREMLDMPRTLGKVFGTLGIAAFALGKLKSITGFGSSKFGGPTGKASDPIYTKDASILGTAGKIGFLDALKGKGGGGIGQYLLNVVMSAIRGIEGLSSAFEVGSGTLVRATGWLTAIGLGLEAAKGAIEGISESSFNIGNFGDAIGFWIKDIEFLKGRL